MWSAVRGAVRPARNRGAATATGDVLAFVDSGDVPCDGWLRQIVETFRDPSVGLASWPAWLIDEAHDRERLNRPGPGVTGVAALATCFAMRRQVFDAVTGYDIALRCGENSDLCERAAAHCVDAGYRIAQAERATARAVLGRPPAYYDRARPMLRSTCSCAMPSSSLRIAQDWCSCARSRPSMRPAVGSGRGAGHAQTALRRGRSLRDLVRLIVTLTPPLARRLWADGGRRACRTSPTTVSDASAR